MAEIRHARDVFVDKTSRGSQLAALVDSVQTIYDTPRDAFFGVAVALGYILDQMTQEDRNELKGNLGALNDYIDALAREARSDVGQSMDNASINALLSKQPMRTH